MVDMDTDYSSSYDFSQKSKDLSVQYRLTVKSHFGRAGRTQMQKELSRGSKKPPRWKSPDIQGLSILSHFIGCETFRSQDFIRINCKLKSIFQYFPKQTIRNKPPSHLPNCGQIKWSLQADASNLRQDDFYTYLSHFFSFKNEKQGTTSVNLLMNQGNIVRHPCFNQLINKRAPRLK